MFWSLTVIFGRNCSNWSESEIELGKFPSQVDLPFFFGSFGISCLLGRSRVGEGGLVGGGGESGVAVGGGH